MKADTAPAALTTPEWLLDQDAIQDRLERMAIPADLKALLHDIARMTAKAGGVIVDIGRRVLSFALTLVKTYPGTAFGLIVGATLAVLASSIPSVGPIIAPFAGPIAMILGLSWGALQDIARNDLGQRTDDMVDHLRQWGL